MKEENEEEVNAEEFEDYLRDREVEKVVNEVTG